MKHDFRVGDKVTWFDEEQEVGTVDLVLSNQLLVQTADGRDKFVLLKDGTLKPYKENKNDG